MSSYLNLPVLKCLPDLQTNGVGSLECRGAVSADRRGLARCRDALKVRGKARFPRKGTRGARGCHAVSLKSKFKFSDTEAIIFVCNNLTKQYSLFWMMVAILHKCKHVLTQHPVFLT